MGSLGALLGPGSWASDDPSPKSFPWLTCDIYHSNPSRGSTHRLCHHSRPVMVTSVQAAETFALRMLHERSCRGSCQQKVVHAIGLLRVTLQLQVATGKPTRVNSQQDCVRIQTSKAIRDRNREILPLRNANTTQVEVTALSRCSKL